MRRILNCVLVAAFAGTPVFAAEDALPEDKLKPEWGAVLSPQEALSLRRDPNIAGAWTPSAQEIAEMEKLLPAAMRLAFDEMLSDEGAPIPVRDYYRQYYGVFSGGKRLIIINGFSETHMQWSRALALPSECSEFLGSDLEGEDGICGPRRAWSPDDWRHKLVSVSDGGCSYFHGAFDTQTRKFEYLGCQGYA